jgi:putative endonuclease
VDGRAESGAVSERGGYTILARNWRCAFGEIDIVALRGEEVVIVEVKSRRSDAYGHPFEAVDAQKRARLWRLSTTWAAAHPAAARGRRLRVDVIGVTGRDTATARIEHLEDVR